MNAASLHEIKKELQTVDPETLAGICLRLAKFKVENKELLTYLLFEAHNEQAYVSNVKEMTDEFFAAMPPRNTYLVKKSLRKILRMVNRQIKYSGVKETEIEVRIHFCSKVKQAGIPLTIGTVLFNMYHQQVKKIYSVLAELPEDIQADYQRDIKKL